MIAVVACGGKSLRMGEDKGLLVNAKTTWAETVFNKLTGLQLPVYVSVNEQQSKLYAAIFEEEYLIEDDATLFIGGPLHGLLSVHKKHPLEDILLLAVDMPVMHEIVLQELLNQYQKHPDKGAIVFSNNGECEPLCGIYNHKALVSILASYQAKELTRHSMKHLLHITDTLVLELPKEWVPYFKNYNSKSDME